MEGHHTHVYISHTHLMLTHVLIQSHVGSTHIQYTMHTHAVYPLMFTRPHPHMGISTQHEHTAFSHHTRALPLHAEGF